MKNSPALSALLLSIATLSFSHGAIIASYDFAANLTSGDSEDSSSASDIQAGSGLGAVNDGWGRSGSLSDLYVRSSVISSSIDPDDYISFTVTTNGGTSYDLTSLTFKYSAQITMSGVGPYTTNIVVRSSLDNFAMDLGSYTLTRVNTQGTNVHSPDPSIDLSSYTNVSGAVEFRIYIYDDVENTQDLTRFDDIKLNATIVPEASGVSLVAFGSLLLGSRRRRR